MLRTKEKEQKIRIRVYCEKEGHKSSEYKVMQNLSECCLKLSQKKYALITYGQIIGPQNAIAKKNMSKLS